MGSPWGQFLNTMTTREDMDEIDLYGAKKAQLLSMFGYLNFQTLAYISF